MIQSCVLRKILSGLGKRPVSSGQAQERGERSGQDFWRDFFLSRKSWWEAHQAWISSLYPTNNSGSQSPAWVCLFDKSFGPILSVKGLVPLWLLTAKPLHASLGVLSSPAFILTVLFLSSSSSPSSPAPSCSPSPALPLPSSPLPRHSPSLAWPLSCQSSEMLLLLQCRGNVTTHIEKRFAVAPSRGGRFAREAGDEQTQSGARKHQSRLLHDVLRGKSHNSAWCQMTNHGTLMQNCFQLLSRKGNESNPKPPMQEQMKLHNGAFSTGWFLKWEDKAIYHI